MRIVERCKPLWSFAVTGVLSVALPGFPEGWDTDVSMSIEGMRGANSTIDNNLPGSEVFMAPVAGSITGVYAIPYPVQFQERILPNIRLVFENGEVKEYDVYYADENDPRRAEDLAIIQKAISKDTGANKIGELGIGTNSNLKKPYLNTLLIEKISGSVHLALGNSYHNKDGAVTFNGNVSKIHIDLTRVLLPEFGGGIIEVDGVVIQQDGKFLIPGTEVLNESDNTNGA